MKTFLVLCAAAGLSGCAVYPVPAYNNYGTYDAYEAYDAYGHARPAPYIVQPPPTYIYGGPGVYRWGGYPPVYLGAPGGYDRPYLRGRDWPAPPAVVVVPPAVVAPALSGPPRPHGPPRPGRGHGEQGRDGDRSRDGDGSPERRDPAPNIPSRRQ